MMPEKAPIRRIVNTILIYAVRDGAKEIRFSTCKERKAFDVYFLCNDELKLQMKIPLYVQQPLYEELRETMGATNDFPFVLHSPELEIKIGFNLSLAIKGEDAVLTLDSHFVRDEGEDEEHCMMLD